MLAEIKSYPSPTLPFASGEREGAEGCAALLLPFGEAKGEVGRGRLHALDFDFIHPVARKQNATHCVAFCFQ